MDPVKTNLIDSSFESPSFTLAGDNLEEAPKLISWDRAISQDGPIFFTDKHITDVLSFEDDPRKKVALLIEPPSLNLNHYSAAYSLRDRFDHVLTFNSVFYQLDPEKFLYYPLGGSWIHPDKWDLYPKTRKMSIIISEKTGAPGHRMRHAIAETYPERIDIWGRGYKSMDTKTLALAHYRFSVVVESVRINGYFSEKLIDCLAVGTTPIYWGAPDINRWFPARGIITFNSLPELTEILINIDKAHQTQMVRFQLLQAAKALRCAEDRIFTHYPQIWENNESKKRRRANLR